MNTTDSTGRGSDIVELATYSHDWEAYIAKGKLDEAGIPCTIDNDVFSSIYPIGFNTIGGITVRVFRRDLERARQITSEVEEG